MSSLYCLGTNKISFGQEIFESKSKPRQDSPHPLCRASPRSGSVDTAYAQTQPQHLRFTAAEEPPQPQFSGRIDRRADSRRVEREKTRRLATDIPQEEKLVKQNVTPARNSPRQASLPPAARKRVTRGEVMRQRGGAYSTDESGRLRSAGESSARRGLRNASGGDRGLEQWQ